MNQSILHIPDEQLPAWVRTATRPFDWGLLSVIIISLLVAWPFLLQSELPREQAIASYVFRTADISAGFSEGTLYPRWSPYALAGYGSPIPNYLPPGIPYSAALIHILFTPDPVTSVRVVGFFLIIGGSIAVYSLVLRHINAAAGIITAALYITAPYNGITIPYAIGNLDELAGLALMPALLWAVSRGIQRGKPGDLLACGFFSAGLILTSPLHLLMALPGGILIIYKHWISQRNRETILYTIAAVALGSLMASFYWVPAIAEQLAVTWQKTGPEQIMPPTTFNGLFAPAKFIDPASMAAIPQISIGWLLPCVTLLSTILAVYDQRYRLFTLGFGLFSLAGLAIAIWANTHWLLGPAALYMAFSSAFIWARIVTEERRVYITNTVILSVILIAAIPVFTGPPPAMPFGQVTPTAQIQNEQQGFGVATLPPGQPVPVPVMLAENLLQIPLRTVIPGGETINRFGISTAQQSNATVLIQGTHRQLYQVNLLSPATVQILISAFPGWTATLNGQRWPIVTNSETGLLEVRLPELDEAQLEITLVDTQTRYGAWIFTAGSLVMLFLLATLRSRQQQTLPFDNTQLLTIRESRLFLVVCVCWLVFIPLVQNEEIPFSLLPEPGIDLLGSIGLESRTDTGLQLLAYRISDNEVRPGDTLSLTLYWQALRFLPDNYMVQLSLFSTSGDRVLSSEPAHPGGRPSRGWPTTRYIADPHWLEIPPDIQTGTYALTIELITCEPDCFTGTRSTFFDRDGQTAGTLFSLPTLIRIQS